VRDFTDQQLRFALFLKLILLEEGAPACFLYLVIRWHCFCCWKRYLVQCSAICDILHRRISFELAGPSFSYPENFRLKKTAVAAIAKNAEFVKPNDFARILCDH